MSFSLPINGHIDARVQLACLSLLADLVIALILTFSKTAARRASFPLTCLAVVLAALSTFNLLKTAKPHAAQPTAVFFPDPPQPSGATRLI